MGTRSVSFIRQGDKNSPVICQIYRQFDGYPEGMGKDLKDICKDITVVNGISGGQNNDKFANGMECLAATIIKNLKQGIGNIYLVPPGEDTQEYNYNVYTVNGKVKVDCVDSAGKKCKIP